MYVHVRASVLGGQKRVSDPMELEFQAVVRHLVGSYELNSRLLLEWQALLASSALSSPSL